MSSYESEASNAKHPGKRRKPSSSAKKESVADPLQATTLSPKIQYSSTHDFNEMNSVAVLPTQTKFPITKNVFEEMERAHLQTVQQGTKFPITKNVFEAMERAHWNTVQQGTKFPITKNVFEEMEKAHQQTLLQGTKFPITRDDPFLTTTKDSASVSKTSCEACKKGGTGTCSCQTSNAKEGSSCSSKKCGTSKKTDSTQQASSTQTLSSSSTVAPEQTKSVRKHYKKKTSSRVQNGVTQENRRLGHSADPLTSGSRVQSSQTVIPTRLSNGTFLPMPPEEAHGSYETQERVDYRYVKNEDDDRGDEVWPEPFPHPGPETGDPGDTSEECWWEMNPTWCTGEATADDFRVWNEEDPTFGEMFLCVGQKRLFQSAITKTNAVYHDYKICIYPPAILSKADIEQNVTILDIVWKCPGAVPSVHSGKTYEPLFPKVGTYHLEATIFIDPPDECWSGSTVLKDYKTIIVDGVKSLTSPNGYANGDILGVDGNHRVRLEAKLFLNTGINTDKMMWLPSPMNAGHMMVDPGGRMAWFWPGNGFVGDVTIKARLCPEDPGAEFRLKIVGNIWIEADKEFLCHKIEDEIHLTAHVDPPYGVGGGDITWKSEPPEAGFLANGAGFTNTFIYNPNYVSSSYKDIIITAALLNEDFANAEATAVLVELSSKGIRKDELSNEVTGENPEEKQVWTPYTTEEINGRLFVDTKPGWDGKCIEETSFDLQYVSFEASVLPGDLPKEIIKVEWLLIDPDDPSSQHPAIDPDPRYDPETDPIKSKDPAETEKMRDSSNKGGDNTGIAYERPILFNPDNPFWFTGDGVSGITSQENYDPSVEKYKESEYFTKEVIGKAETELNLDTGSGFLKTGVEFNFSDHGGDNFKVKLILLEYGEPVGCTIETGTLTVWRKRCVEIMRMAPLVAHYEREHIEHYQRPWEDSWDYKTLDYDFGDNNYYPWDDPANGPLGIRNALSKSYSPAFIDFYVKNATATTQKGENPQLLPYQKFIGYYLPDGTGNGIEAELKLYADKYIENWYTSAKPTKPIHTIKIIGVHNLYTFWDTNVSKGEKISGYTPQYTPYLFIPLERLNDDSYATAIVHEMGHCLSHSYKIGSDTDFIWGPVDMHGYDAALLRSYETHDGDCAFQNSIPGKGNITNICNRHIRLLRNSIQRLWWNIEPEHLPPRTTADLTEVLLRLTTEEQNKIFD